MKKTLIVVLGLAMGSQAFAASRVLQGRDDLARPCSLEFVKGTTVRVNYAGSMLFDLMPSRLPDGRADRSFFSASRRLVTASTQMDFQLSYYPAQRYYRYAEMRANIHTGDIFSENYRECRLGN